MPGIYRFSGIIYDSINKTQIGFTVTEDTGAEHKISFKQAIKLYDQNRLVDCLLKNGRTPFFCGRNGLKLSELPVYKFKDGVLVQSKTLRVGVEIVESENYMEDTEKVIYKIKGITESKGVHIGRIRDKADSYGRFKVYTAAFRLADTYVGQITVSFLKSKNTPGATLLEVSVRGLPQTHGLAYTEYWETANTQEGFNSISELVNTDEVAKTVSNQLIALNSIVKNNSTSDKLDTLGRLFTYTYNHNGISVYFTGTMGKTDLKTSEAIALGFKAEISRGTLFSGEVIYDNMLNIDIKNGPKLKGVTLNMAKSFLKEALAYYTNLHYTQGISQIMKGFNSIIPKAIQLGVVSIINNTPDTYEILNGAIINLEAKIEEYTHRIVGTIQLKNNVIQLKVFGPTGTPMEKKVKTVILRISNDMNIDSQRQLVAQAITGYYT